MNKLVIDFLYLDLCRCERCQSADQTLDEVLAELRSELKVIDYLKINKIRMTDKTDEERYDFKRSPTIRINGKDVEEVVSGELRITDNYCGSCSDICGEDTNCRTFKYKGETSEDIPKGLLKEGLLKTLSQYEDLCCNKSCNHG